MLTTLHNSELNNKVFIKKCEFCSQEIQSKIKSKRRYREECNCVSSYLPDIVNRYEFVTIKRSGTRFKTKV